MAGLSGAPFHGEFTSADASALSEANSHILLYGWGQTSAITVGASDYVQITDIVVVAGSALTVTVYDGADNVVGTGEVLFRGNLPVTGVMSWPGTEPHLCQKGTWPKVKTSGVGQVDVTIRGQIVRPGA